MNTVYTIDLATRVPFEHGVVKFPARNGTMYWLYGWMEPTMRLARFTLCHDGRAVGDGTDTILDGGDWDDTRRALLARGFGDATEILRKALAAR